MTRNQVGFKLTAVLMTALTFGSAYAADNTVKSESIAVASPPLRKLIPIADKPQPMTAPPASRAPEPATGKAPATPNTPQGAVPQSTADEYPTLGRMEQITFGHANMGLPLDTRLNYLEATIFRSTFATLSPQQRAAKLQETLLGAVEDTHFPTTVPVSKPGAQTTAPAHSATQIPATHPAIKTAPPAEPQFHPEEEQYTSPTTTSVPTPAHSQPKPEDQADNKFLEAEKDPFYQVSVTPEEMKAFALQLVNDRRQMSGLTPLSDDEIAAKVAHSHAHDMAKRNAISHFSGTGENPDERYTKAGGTDSLTESLSVLNEGAKPTRLTAVLFLRDMFKRQDDRDSLMSPDATGFAFAFADNHAKTRSFACCEVITKHSIMQPLPHRIKVGEKLEVKGVMLEPYKIDRVTLAWEKPNPEALSSADETDECLPYFPPLDFVAYASKSEHDWSTGVSMLKAAGVVACLAGGMFIPPVALGAPVLMMSGNPDPEPKAVSDIPVKGGIKVTGQLFAVKVGISNDNKPGLYYLTVWGITPGATKAVPISRRIIVASTEHESEPDSSKEDKEKDKHEH